MSSVTPEEHELPDIISVDDHVMEPKNLWQEQLPPSMRSNNCPTIMEAAILTRLLPSRIAPSRLSPSDIKRLTRPAASVPSFSSCSMRARDVAVRDVSDPEKKADRQSSPTIMSAGPTRPQSMLI